MCSAPRPRYRSGRMGRPIVIEHCPPSLGSLGVRWLDRIGADDADGEDRTVELHREPGGAGAALVEPAVAAARAFGEDAEELTALEHLLGGIECRGALVAAAAIDRDHAQCGEQVLRLPRVHVFGLADEGDVAPHHQHQERRVEEADVVRAQDRRAVDRQPFQAARRRWSTAAMPRGVRSCGPSVATRRRRHHSSCLPEYGIHVTARTHDLELCVNVRAPIMAGA